MLPDNPSPSIRIALLDDHPTVLWGLQKLIESASPQLTVVAVATCRAQLLSALEQQDADIVLLDVDLGPENGLDMLPELRARGTKVVILSGLRDSAIQEQAMLAGASGFLRKTEPADVILRAIDCVHRGQIWLDRSTTAKVMTSLWEQGSKERAPDIHATLTSTERKIIAAVVKHKGAPNKVIADALHISAHTLRNHLASIYEKLGVHRRLDLVFYAMQHGLDAELERSPGLSQNAGTPERGGADRARRESAFALQ